MEVPHFDKVPRRQVSTFGLLTTAIPSRLTNGDYLQILSPRASRDAIDKMKIVFVKFTFTRHYGTSRLSSPNLGFSSPMMISGINDKTTILVPTTLD